ncbi:hypothetical protein CLV52_3677 [Amnibacterium kyonggiense]|uniref:Uncharacterized protein n=2 Tax=Amnibacterium kyonggiense TaxID=595671 RepID=A0A4R7FIR9_9MICO|nr:hypothetical protein CLV52_3677 [Amnibacterium kyonggiense]
MPDPNALSLGLRAHRFLFLGFTALSALGMTSTSLWPGFHWQPVGVDATTTAALVTASTFTTVRKIPAADERKVAMINFAPVAALIVVGLWAQEATFAFHLIATLAAAVIFTIGATRSIWRSALFMSLASAAVLAIALMSLIAVYRPHVHIPLILINPIFMIRTLF